MSGIRGACGLPMEHDFDGFERPPKLVEGNVRDAKARVKTQALIGHVLPNHLFLHNRHGEPQLTCNL